MISEKINHREMYAILFFTLLRFISNANARDNDFIRDYFMHKAVRNVVRFSCGDITSMSNVSVKISEIKISNYLKRKFKIYRYFLKNISLSPSFLFSFYHR